MPTPYEYRARAAILRTAADEALTPELRVSLLAVEAEWLRLASTAELVPPEEERVFGPSQVSREPDVEPTSEP